MSGTLNLTSTIRFPASTRQMRSHPRFTVQAVSATVDARKATNLYEILCIKQTASQTEIKTAYRTLAKRFHPDTGSDGRDFMQIHEAYATLSDPSARALYDRSAGAGRRYSFARETVVKTRRWETDQCW